jgi:hypothetical protein
MVTTTDEDLGTSDTPVGAIAAFGGKVQSVVAETTRKVTFGEVRIGPPMALIVLTYIPVLAAPERWQQALGVITLIALTVWVCAQVMRSHK